MLELKVNINEIAYSIFNKYIQNHYSNRYIKINNFISVYKSPANKDVVLIAEKFEEDVVRFYNNRLPLGIIKDIFNSLKEKN